MSEASLDKSVRKNIIDREYKRLLEPVTHWVRPELVEAIGPNDLDMVAKFEETLPLLKAEVRSDLEAMTDEAFNFIGQDPYVPYEINNLPEIAAIRLKIAELQRIQPSIFACGFGAVPLRADFSYWRTMPKLTLHEALMLSVGLNPALYSPDRLNDLAKRRSKKTLCSALQFLLDRREVFYRFYPAGVSGYMSMSFPLLKRALETYGVELDQEFREALAARCPDAKHAHETPNPSKSISSQERDTLLKLIAGMAAEQYGFDPRHQRSETIKNIQEDLDRAGLSMDAKTVRKWIRQAAELIPDVYWKD
ncbi:hypothetical protein [Rhodalgimonas zhirmunskyi]|uniref:Uncharacterized protein n=1 Tax=Rhodalgimonas zhirmunskyi TaxID=2964767 RepID=A0AAJ1X5P1_9RHOB|nr:hypothetical protein [Rhodoalgimonas zhirmunskyi]MDQ2094354.1 hypothetical protein [Rhodoalgimonas zhirmunskyi]